MNKTRRLTAVALVLLLLLSLCGCIAEELPEEISRPETTRTTPATTLSTAPTTTQAVTATDTTAATSDNTTTQTATQTATTVVTTQVTTKVTATATGSTAAPTTAAPQKPTIEWNVIKGELPEDGITPGAAFPCGKAVLLQLGEMWRIEDEAFVYGNIIETAAAFDALNWGEMAPWAPTYEASFFEENVLIEFVFIAQADTMFATVKFSTFDDGTLYLHLECLNGPPTVSSAVLYPARVLVEMSYEDALLIENMVVYETYRNLGATELLEWLTK